MLLRMSKIAAIGFFLVAAMDLSKVAEQVAYAQTTRFLSHGPEAKAAAGAGSTIASGPLAAFYNPSALMSVKRVETYSELAVMDLQYTYKTPGFDSVKLRVTTPIATLGAASRIGKRFVFGLMMLPIPGGASKLTVKNIPSRQLSTEPGLIDVSTSNGKAFGYQLATGFAYSIVPEFEVGGAFNHSRGEVDLMIADSASGSEVLAVNSMSTTASYSLGVRARLFKSLQLGVTYKSPAKSSVRGQFKNEGGAKFSNNPISGDEANASFQATVGAFIPFVEVNHFRASKGKGSISPLTPQDGIAAEIYDITSFVVGTQLKVVRGQRIVAAAGWYPTSIGAGATANLDDGSVEMHGIQFGDIDAISRKVFSGGYLANFNSLTTGISALYSEGSREVSESSRGYGHYSLKILTLSSSLKWRF